jgi:hypothetical protein
VRVDVAKLAKLLLINAVNEAKARGPLARRAAMA